jgi:hypothetical protein
LILRPIGHCARDIPFLTPLGPSTEKKGDGLLYCDVVDTIARADINLQFPHAIAAETMVSQVPGVDDAVDSALYGDSSGDIANLVKPVLIDIMSAGIKVMQDLHKYLRL